MAGKTRRIAAALLAAGTVTLTGCATVPGTGSADPTAVQAYESTLASSRAEAAASAAKSACASWRTGYDTRFAATKAMADYTRTPGANWDGITPTLDANIAAIATESGKLPGIITTADPNPNIRGLLVDYKTKLDAYGDGLKADRITRGTEDKTWAKAGPAEAALASSARALRSACG
ncbi:Lipoprotein OS=Tsukamurella paurometabola (strain ATCC 8368 / DSM / CCUG 35730 / CIP 100753/ JCM 10117 / KCTC 9821 / NBRC 16120 / NCIMB 702349 / NCTC 13040)OX=521096 GN=Tpau_3425 PE=4 SV=1 [Tsukamurella paurometabola]|uniref:Lipoprotein n=1 Tax=Tsukamurella paurometabola (strain ATCC 8368 / DSM 20162 / CCUG 35730 / CIP 100753 / JCM 10117 / KCTC 9821 / NBRC 16120 / NCIMB 702349 / NCTC 13040) TaxID=521096 RepID=D5UWL0_TSUPD|nr:hypothetical protein [Tsukamurella paurometabola]ADG80009.1 hypothetical protein Tpau_3425 [Tsukamurella paurometabola DSM 20162]SUP38031.1 Uncharacterised protein [Tsukamurella paurometabola]